MSPTESSSSALLSAPEGSRYRRAYEAILPEMQALKPEEVVKVNLDIPTKVPDILGALSAIRAQRAEIVVHLPTFNIQRFDQLENYLLAMAYAHSATLSPNATPEELKDLADKASNQRNLLLSIARTLVLWGLLTPEQIKDFRGQTGYKQIAFELMGLAGLFRNEWAKIGRRTGLELTELEQFEQHYDRLLSALGLRKRNEEAKEEEVQLKHRAFTLFKRAYIDAEYAIQHLRREQDDADEIIPPLYPGRQRRVNKGEDTPPIDQVPAPVAPVVPPADSPVVPAGPAAPVVPGGPGGNPFLR